MRRTEQEVTRSRLAPYFLVDSKINNIVNNEAKK
jgi:hypothetical protein